MKEMKPEVLSLFQKIRNRFKSDRFNEQYNNDSDIRRILLSSALLQISEFRFFQIAYRQWYGREISENRMEYIFEVYMYEDIVPHYVRHLTRKVICLFDQGILDPGMFNIDRPKTSPAHRSTGIGYTIMLAIILVIFCFAITDYVPFE